MSPKKYCIECRSLNVERLWKARKFGRPALKLAKYYADRVEVTRERIIIHIGLRGYRQTSKANVWRRLPGNRWECLRLDYPETAFARQQRKST